MTSMPSQDASSRLGSDILCLMASHIYLQVAFHISFTPRALSCLTNAVVTFTPSAHVVKVANVLVPTGVLK